MKKFIFLMIGVMFLMITPTMIVSATTGSNDDHTFFTDNHHENDGHENDDHDNGGDCDKTCTEQTSETRFLDCGIGLPGSITETRTKSSHLTCAWGEWVETANTCKENTYSVTPSAGDNGTISPNIPQTVNYNQTTSFTVTPSVGYIATVGGSCGGTLVNGIYTTNNITANCSVVASFEKTPVDNFTVTASAVGHGTITPATQSVTPGLTVNFTVTPEAGYATSDFTGTCPLGTLNGATWTTGNIIADCNVIATFTKIPVDSATISATKIVCPTIDLLPEWGAGGPDVTSTTASAFLEANTTCHSVPWTFEWAPSATSNPGDQVGIAGGTWTSFTGNTTIPAGAKVWVREQFNDDYIPFTGVTTTNSNSAGLYCSTDVLNYDNYDSINTVNKNNTYYCVGFNVLKSIPVETFTVTSSAVGNGTITPATQSITSGSTVNFTVTPEAGYSVAMSGTCPIGTSNGTTYTTGSITADCTVVATFTKIPAGSYTLTVETIGTGHGQTTGTGSYTSGTTVTATAIPDSDSIFSGWSENCPAGVVTVTSNTTCTATFTLKSVETFTVLASAGTNGSVTPASQQIVAGQKATLTVTPATGYKASFDGTCPIGTLSGTTYTTGNITSDCAIIVIFSKIDVCPNIAGDQTTVPSGKYINKAGDCVRKSSGGSTGGSIPVITTPGQVLGEATTCGIYVDKYLKMGLKGNDKNAVIKIQQFLNDYMGSGLKIDGILGAKTDKAIRAFQAKRFEKVLAPWGLEAPTSIFYLTTQTEVNNIMCPPLNLPIPTLIPTADNPAFPQF